MNTAPKLNSISTWLGAGAMSLGLLAGSLGLGAHPASADANINASFVNPAGQIGVGEQLTYTVRVRNAGTEGTANVNLSLSVAGGGTVVSVSQANGSRFQGGCQVAGDSQARCTGGFFDRNEQSDVLLRVRAPQAAGEMRVTARANRGTDDPATRIDAFARAETQVIVRPDLVVTDIDGPSAVGDGANGSYVVTVRNRGGSTATGVRLVVRSESLPWDFFQVDVLDDGSNFSCALTQTLSFQTPTVTCTGGNLSANETARVRIRARTSNVIGTGNGRIQAIVDAGNFIRESNEDNNTRSQAVSFNGGIL
jgi:uncharacterized repeat protein (TIGR01451 family)